MFHHSHHRSSHRSKSANFALAYNGTPVVTIVTITAIVVTLPPLPKSTMRAQVSAQAIREDSEDGDQHALGKDDVACSAPPQRCSATKHQTGEK
jgi:hypothetical protein